MSDISRTGGAKPQQTQQQEQAVSQEQPRQENQQRFAQKLKEGGGKKASAKNEKNETSEKSEKSETSEKKDNEEGKHTIGSGARQVASKATTMEQKPSVLAATRDKGEGDRPPSQEFEIGKDSAKRMPEEKGKLSSARGDAILQGLQPQGLQPQGLQPQAPVDNVAMQATQQTKSSIESSDRLFQEFQTVADRVMHTSQSLQQGGSVRLQLGNNVLPGTSVTFSMAGGALHVTFSGSNKKSLDKVREHEAGLVDHVRKQSGVDIVVSTQDEQQSDQQRGGSF